MSPYAPTADAKAILIERSASLAACLAPANPAEILKEVAALNVVMKHREHDVATSEAVIRVYATDLGDQPYFAIIEACTAFRRNLVGDGWMPTPGELLTVAKQKSEWVRKERIEIERVLNAEVVAEKPKAERRSIRDKADAVIAELRNARTLIEIARGFDPPDTTKGDGLTAEERLEQTAMRYREAPVTLSFDATRRAAA